ncbi:MAG: PqqD family protein [Chloroflexota bacterium]|nr:MAG: PqqD family protein [Chloroflexota bacterium]
MIVGRPRRRDDVVFREVGAEESFLYDPVRRCVHVLNASAGVVWTLSDGTREPAEIAAQLAERFDVPADACVRQDVERMIEQFRDLQVLSSNGDVQ